MSVERLLVEQLVSSALHEAEEVKDDPRLRDVVSFGTHLAAAVIYGLGEIDNDLWFMIKALDEQVADNAIIMGKIPDDLQGIDAEATGEMSAEEVRQRITDRLRAAESILKSTNLLPADTVVMQIVFQLGKAFVLQLRELNDDECALTTAIESGGARLGTLINGLGRQY